MDAIENDLRGVVKALSDVVQPALDPADPLAAEQLRLAINYLEFVRTRLDFMPARRRFELRDNLALARALVALAGELVDGLAVEVESAMDEGERLLSSPDASAEALRAAAAKLAAASRMVVRESASSPAKLRDEVERTVLDRSRERILFERSWFLPIGGDRKADEVPSLAQLV